MDRFDYAKMPLEAVNCNLCESDNAFRLANRSANGMPVETRLCKRCGLIYINPHMTREAYDTYYKYFYRQDRQNSKGFLDGGGELDRNFQAARKFGGDLAERFVNYFGKGLTLDVGSSTGGVLYGVREKVGGVEALGVEPSEEESSYARRMGIETYTGLFENFVKNRSLGAGSASNILCVRSLNHLLDPRSLFLWSYGVLKKGGHLILSVKDFRKQARRAGFLEAGIQIDHPYMFTPESLKLFAESAGFKIAFLGWDWRKGRHIILIAEKPSVGNIPVDAISPGLYFKLRWQLWKPYLKFYYLMAHSHKLRRFNLHKSI